jgi:hypothetical protein
MDLQNFRGLQEAYVGVYVDLNESSLADRFSDANARLKMEDEHEKTKHVREDLDLYDLILTHLLDEGYANTPEGAVAIMANMSEGWKTELATKALRTTARGTKRVAKAVNKSKTVQNLKKKAGRFVGNTILGALTGIPLE